MTSSEKSSVGGTSATGFGPIEVLGGVFHPHAIEIQDFSMYALVIDLRPHAEYAADHIPGAVHVAMPAAPTTVLSTGVHPARLTVQEPGAAVLPPGLAAVLAPVPQGELLLVYCGSGGQVSHPVAETLRLLGYDVDVLPGGYGSYRRWAKVGIDLLPRMVRFNVIACTLGSESLRVLRALDRVGHQTIDLHGLMAWRPHAFGARAQAQPGRAWLESQVLNALRQFDPRRPVWVADTDNAIGRLELPGAMPQALAIASVAELDVPAAARVAAWREDEALVADPAALLARVDALRPPPALSDAWRAQLAQGQVDDCLAAILTTFLDPAEQAARATRLVRHAMPALSAKSLAETDLDEAVRRWMPPPTFDD